MTLPEIELMLHRLAEWRLRNYLITKEAADVMTSLTYLAWLAPLASTPERVAFPCAFRGFIRASTTPHAFRFKSTLAWALATWVAANQEHTQDCCPTKDIAGNPLWPENQGAK